MVATLFAKRIRDDIAPKVAADAAYQNASENTSHTARMAHDQALGKAMQILLKDDTQIYKLFVENDSFRRCVGVMVYAMTSRTWQYCQTDGECYLINSLLCPLILGWKRFLS